MTPKKSENGRLSGKETKPYISFVATARNDNYGYGFLSRAQNFLDSLVFLCEKYKLHSEMIFVEWNPPLNQRRLWQDLKIPKGLNFIKIRFIEVPFNIHKTFKESDRFPIFEYIGKNVGIRRARGDFVLITNPDLVFSDKLIQFLASRKLRPDKFYRTSRFGLEEHIPVGLTSREIIDFCKRNWMTKMGVFFNGINFRKTGLRDLGSRLKIYRGNLFLLLGYFSGSGRRKFLYKRGAPGDFLLMSKESLIKLSGFPEFSTPTNLVDIYLVHVAAASGLGMVALSPKLGIYHQFHYRLSFGKIGKRKWDFLSKSVKNAEEMLKNKKVIPFNNQKWGLVDIKLKERTF